MIVYLKTVKGLKCGRSRESTVARWVARDWENARVGVGLTRQDAIRNMQPLGKAVESGKFINQFLAATALRYEPPHPAT